MRHSAFTRGAAYLERYCLLISFAAFLERAMEGLGPERSFSEWMEARPDVCQARSGIHQNPAGALAPVAVAGLPHLWLGAERTSSQAVMLFIHLCVCFYRGEMNFCCCCCCCCL